MFLSLIDRKFIINVLDNIFKETFILDNCQASGATNVKSNYDALVHIDLIKQATFYQILQI